MTKNDLINAIHSLKIDLKYLKQELQFRMDGNDIKTMNINMQPIQVHFNQWFLWIIKLLKELFRLQKKQKKIWKIANKLLY